jgi:hypothetical protein
VSPWRFFVLSFVCPALLWPVNTIAEPMYQQIDEIDLVGGHVPDDTWIETTGRVWATREGVFFGLGMPSAMAPIRLDVSSVAPEQVVMVTGKCKADSTFEEGCRASLRGKTGRVDGRRGVFATRITLQ